MIAKRFVGCDAFAVGIGSSGPTLTGALVIHPGQYVFQGQSFDCSAEGYYVFWDPIGAVTSRKIVFGSDVATLMSSFAMCAAVGRLDNGLSVGAALADAVTSELRMLCGPTVAWAKALCDSLGGAGFASVTTRIARAVTGGTPSGYFDGHVMIEARVGGAWQLFDLACGTSFGAAALKDALPLLAPVTKWVNKGVDQSPAAVGQFDTVAWVETTLSDPASFQSEMMRVLQIPGIDYSDGNTYWYLPPAFASCGPHIAGLSGSYRVVSQSTWLSMFYS